MEEVVHVLTTCGAEKYSWSGQVMGTDRKPKHQERGKKKKKDVRGLRKWEQGRRGPEGAGEAA